MNAWVIGAIALFTAGGAQAQAREFCADRPGLGTPPCTVAPGTVMAELGLADWTRDEAGGERIDTIVAGDLLLRVGVTETVEAQVGWTAYGHQRQRVTTGVTRSGGIGDVFLALRANLRNPDGSGTSLAVMPYASLPSGGDAIGAGDWSAGLAVPMSFDLGAASLALTPSIEAAVDEDRSGRHLRFGSVVGVGFDLADTLSTSLELSLHRDEDAAERKTEPLAGVSLAWQPNAGTQLDAGINLGLNRDSPDVQLYVGVARRF